MTRLDPDASPGVLALAESLALTEIDVDLLVGGPNLRRPHGPVFGGQVLAQVLLAAVRTVAADRLPHSVHAYFLRPGNVECPVTLAVERLRDGRSLSARRVVAMQDGKQILTAMVSLQVPETGLDHGVPMPAVAPPEGLPPIEEELADAEPSYRRFWGAQNAFDLRHVDGSVHAGPAPTASARQMVWVRARAALDAPEVVHRALLAFVSDQVVLHPVLRRHGRSLATPGLMIASIDHAMWWYASTDVTQWHLLVQEAPAARSARGLGVLNIFRADGTLVASAAQEGIVRLRSGA